MKSETKKILPRYQRLTQEKPSFILQARDIEIINTVYEYRFLNSELIKALFKGSERGILLRLQKLFHHSYLDRLKGSVSRPIVYALGDRGADLLSESSGLDRGQIIWRKKNQEVKEYYLAHTLQMANFRATLFLALKDKPKTKIISWFPEREIKDEVMIKEGYYKKIRASLIPDAFLTIEDKEDLLNFFLECDRSTMTQWRFLNKMKAYWHYWKEEQHKKKLEIDSFRVLTITKSQERKENLRELTKQADDKKTGSEMFWFTSEENYNLKDPQSILKPIWQTPRDDIFHHLLE